ncbi:MAG: guanylate kinase [Clostridiales bacterium]|nr:guanylate kinase [Clostridiales bacterium]
MKGALVVISGPSGTGKGTVISSLLNSDPNAMLSVSCTTRAMRPGEVDGVHYFFITDEKFSEMIQQEAFLEYADVFGMNRYGTPRAFVEEKTEEGRDVYLDIDVVGAMNVKKAMDEALLIFLMPPSFEELERRLRGRGTETEEQIQKRLGTAKGEMAYADKYDYTVVNDDIDACVEQIKTIISQYKASRR